MNIWTLQLKVGHLALRISVFARTSCCALTREHQVFKEQHRSRLFRLKIGEAFDSTPLNNAMKQIARFLLTVQPRVSGV